MAHLYPRVGSAPKFQEKWAAIPARKAAPLCCACDKRALYKVFVEESIFRGEDSGPFRACEDHKRDAALLLESTWPTAA
ncbi:hypothetical protein [Variovorax boronicumulans]|uniref:hypothetical protein n=1 Tax=Variovorax boronicumulans TaxID=436515 RepID=UPI0012E50458|nr:hypothetical protein [Variovorax boronicumulans]GER16728.1 hypothetical protein VCH24_17350 [Variovorax boronicumulans]